MSRLGEALLRAIVAVRQRHHPISLDRPSNDRESYFRWQLSSSADLFAKYPGLDVVGKSVLDIGCGIGGRTAYLACMGAERVIGIDVNAGEIEIARRLCAKLCPPAADRAEFVACREDARLEIGQFDVVLLVDALEHVVSPCKMVQAAYDYVAPGGKFYFGTLGWYHHSGSHSGLLPFVHLFFSDETILNVIRWQVSRPEYVRTPWDSDPPVERWRGIYDLRDRPGEHLNKITIREMKKLARYSPFSESRLTVLGLGRPRWLAPLLGPLRQVPLLQEVFHSYVVGEFRK